MSPVLHVEGCRTLLGSVVPHHQLSSRLVFVAFHLSIVCTFCPLYFITSSGAESPNSSIWLALSCSSRWTIGTISADLMLLVWQARVGNSTLTCPAHVCHTCASEVRPTHLVRHSLNNLRRTFIKSLLNWNVLNSSDLFVSISFNFTFKRTTFVSWNANKVPNCFKFNLGYY